MKEANRSAPLTVLSACGVDIIRREAITIWILMVRAFPLLFLLICSGNATELLRDKHTDTTYIFKSDAKDVSAGINQKDAVLRVDEWAAGFYGDALLQFVECQFKTNPWSTILCRYPSRWTGCDTERGARISKIFTNSRMHFTAPHGWRPL